MSAKTQKKKTTASPKKRAVRKRKSSSSGAVSSSRSGYKRNTKTVRKNVNGIKPEMKKNKQRHSEFVGVILIALSILFGLSIYLRNMTGIVGEIILHVSTGLLGFVAFFTPPLLFAYGLLYIFYPKRPKIRNKAAYTFILLLLVGGIFHTAAFQRSDYVNMSMFQYIKAFYQQGRSIVKIPYTMNGGVVGGMLSVPLCFLLQKTGAIIILGTGATILAMAITEISIKKTVVHTVNHVKNHRDSRMEVYDDELFEQDDPVFLKELDEPVEGQKNRIHSGTDRKASSSGKIIDFPMDKKDVTAYRDGMDDTPVQNENQNGGEMPVKIKSRKTSSSKKRKKEAPIKDIRVMPMQDREYHFPPFSCMQAPDMEGMNSRKLRTVALENAHKLEKTLSSFGIEAQVVHVGVGPAFTRFEVQPGPGMKVSRIVNLTDDIALSLAAQGIRIEAPIPGKAAVGIEVPNKEVAPIYLREVLETPDFVKFKSRLAVGLGKDISGENTIIDLAKMPHLLIAGATGSGKSVCINSIITSLLYKATPEEVKLLLIDPKVVELGVYNGIPHLLIPVVTDPSKAAGALQWAVQEMVNRYKLFADKGVRDLTGYNRSVEKEVDGFKLPQIVLIIDELADLMMVAPHDVEDSICRLAQMARAAGMHLVIATQRPSVNVITGVIKANIPSRIAFAVSSQVDSRTILDMGGAEKLLGKGDMLYFPVGMQKPIRVKGAFISDEEVEEVVNYVKSQVSADYDEEIIDKITATNDDSNGMEMDADEFLPKAIELVVECGQASVSLIQRRLKVGYARAGRIVDQMAERGIISGFEGSKPRKVLITREQLEEMKMGSQDNG